MNLLSTILLKKNRSSILFNSIKNGLILMSSCIIHFGLKTVLLKNKKLRKESNKSLPISSKSLKLYSKDMI